MKSKTITLAGFDVSVVKISYETYRWTMFIDNSDYRLDHISNKTAIFDAFNDRHNFETNYRLELERETAEWIAAMNGIKLIFKV